MRTAKKHNDLTHRAQCNHGLSGTVRTALSILLLSSLAACGIDEVLMDRFRGETPRERYVERLERAGLHESRMAVAWQEAGARAFSAAVDVSPPMNEEAWLSPGDPSALGYRLEVQRGQQLRVSVGAEAVDQDVFVELFRLRSADEDDSRPLLVRWTEDRERDLVHDARTTASYLVRIQPELLGGGPVSVSIEVGASLAFPVDGHSTGNVGSFFGDVRDGGARDHHGVDIFAPRGTPVLAATDGVAYRVGVNNLGGNVVWVRDPTGDVRQYYAHLHEQLVTQGQEVSVGDTLGLVGNTGNAITTPPHLHFGIYLRGAGPVDPMPFLRNPGGSPAPLALPREAFGEVYQLRGSDRRLRSSPATSGTTLATLDPELPVTVVGGSGSWFRIRTPAGVEGYVPESMLEAAGELIDPGYRIALAFPTMPAFEGDPLPPEFSSGAGSSPAPVVTPGDQVE